MAQTKRLAAYGNCCPKMANLTNPSLVRYKSLEPIGISKYNNNIFEYKESLVSLIGCTAFNKIADWFWKREVEKMDLKHQEKLKPKQRSPLYYLYDSLRRLNEGLELLFGCYKRKLRNYNLRQIRRSAILLYEIDLSVRNLVLIDLLKSSLATPIAKVLGNPPPVSKYGNCYNLSKIVNSYFGSGARNTTISICFAINNLKRIFLPLPTDYREAMEAKHRETMESQPKKLPQFLKKRFNRYLQELFPYGWNKNYDYKAYSTKTAACLEIPRSKGGQRMANKLYYEEFKKRSNIQGPEIIVTDPEGHSKLYYDSEYFDHAVSDFQFRDRYPCQTACVEDPLKIRIITKNLQIFRFLKGLQESCWKYLSKFPCFIFTSTPASPEYFSPIFRTLNLGARTLWISGDYSSATDNLPPEGSEMILQHIVDSAIIDSKLAAMATDSLTNHLIKYNYIKGQARQSNGQLMGSLLSFPVLCLYNLFLYWYSFEKYQKTKISGAWITKRLLINGDDILFAATPLFYKIWWDIVEQFGLTPSVGKNFSHHFYFTINSEIFKWNYDSRTAIRVAFPKVQFFFNVDKVNFDQKSKHIETNVLPALIENEQRYQSQPNTIYKYNKELFITNLIKRSHYSKYDFRNLWLDRRIGGHGCQLLPNTRVRISPLQMIYIVAIELDGFRVVDYMSIKDRNPDLLKVPRFSKLPKYFIGPKTYETHIQDKIVSSVNKIIQNISFNNKEERITDTTYKQINAYIMRRRSRLLDVIARLDMEDIIKKGVVDYVNNCNGSRIRPAKRGDGWTKKILL